MVAIKMELLQWIAVVTACLLFPEIENQLICNKKLPNFCKGICSRNYYQFRFADCCAKKCPMVSAARCRSTFRTAIHGTHVLCPRYLDNKPVCYTPDNGTTFAYMDGRCDLCELMISQPHLAVREVHLLRCLLRNVTLTATLH